MGFHVNLAIYILKQIKGGVFVGYDGIHQRTHMAGFKVFFPKPSHLLIIHVVHDFHPFPCPVPNDIVYFFGHLVPFVELGHNYLVVFVGFEPGNIITAFFQDIPVFFNAENGPGHRTFEMGFNFPHVCKLRKISRHIIYLRFLGL